MLLPVTRSTTILDAGSQQLLNCGNQLLQLMSSLQVFPNNTIDENIVLADDGAGCCVAMIVDEHITLN